MARKVLASFRKNYPEVGKMRLVGSDLPDQCRPHLLEAARKILPLGYTFICDIEDANGTETVGFPMVLRYFGSQDLIDGVATFYSPTFRCLLYELATPLSDGRLLVTVNAPIKTSILAEIEFLTLAINTSFVDLRQAHRDRVDTVLRIRPDLREPMPSSTEQNLEESQKWTRKKHEYRRQIGWVTEQELIAMSGLGHEQRARQIFHEIQRLLLEEEE